jgi:nitrogen PTS system EIIA component
MIDTKEPAVRLADHLRKEDVHLDLTAGSPLDVMREMAGLLGLATEHCSALLKGLQRRESMESTAVGHGFAVPHCRRAGLPRLRLAYARLGRPVPWGAADGEPVRHVFLLVAPHLSPEYLPVLAKIAHGGSDPQFRRRLDQIRSTDELFQLLADAGV